MEFHSVIRHFQGLFPFLREEDINAILNISRIEPCGQGEFFIRAGEIRLVIAMVLEGLIRGYYLTEEGNEMTPFFWEENSMVASWENIYKNTPSGLDFQALENSSLLVLDYVALRSLLEVNFRILKAYTAMMEEIMTNSLLHLQTYIHEKPESRYRRLQMERPVLMDRLSQRHIASFLGITPISFSRMKKRLSK